MPNLLDVYSDKSLKGMTDMLQDNPDYYDKLKNTEVDYDSLDSLPDSSFAYPEERAFPINNDNMALLSALYNNYYEPEVPEEVGNTLKKAAYLYGFEYPENIKKANKNSKEAAVKEVKEGIKEADYLLPHIKRFPVRNIQEGKLIQNILVKNAHIMGYNDLFEASNRLLTKMASFKCKMDDIHPTIYKYAGLTLSNKEMLSDAIESRKSYTKEANHKNYDELLGIVKDMDYNRNNLIKVASALEKIDTISQVRHLYDKHIMNPIDSVFNTKKVYSPFEKEANISGFTPEMAQRVTPDQIKMLLGQDVLDASMADNKLNPEQLADVVNSLPTDVLNDFVGRI